MSLTIQDVTSGVVAAVRHFGPAYTAPYEFVSLRRIGGSAVYAASMNDTRLNSRAGPMFHFDINTVEYATVEDVRAYVIARIEERDNSRASA